MLTGTIDPVDLDIRAIISEEFSPAARNAVLADIARQELTAAEETNRSALGFVPGHLTIVDGSLGASEDSVRPDGEIDYTFQLLPDLFGWILSMLEQFAPVLSGQFKASFELYADGAPIDPKGEPPPATEYVFISSAIYAREIEGGWARRPESRQAPNGVFEAVAVLAQQYFGTQANIRFTYRAPFAGEVLVGHPGRQAVTRTPAIVITLGV